MAFMRRSRRIDPESFDLTTECPECHHTIPPNELLHVDGGRMRCPNCKQTVLLPLKGAAGTAVPK